MPGRGGKQHASPRIVLGAVSGRELAVSSIKTVWIAAAVVVIVGGLATVGGAAGARVVSAGEPYEAERHCVIAVTAVYDGVLVTEPEVCFATPAQADRHAALVGTGRGRLSRALRSSGTNTIGTHFTSTSYRGSSVRVVGTTCGGGVWYPTGAWNNNIESSLHHCGTSPTSFYDYSSCAGSSHRIYQAASSLGQWNNRASCVRYG